MKISTRTRYGTRLMLNLGLHYGGGSIFLKDIAKDEEISEKYLSQIIIPLKSAGFVSATRGAHGGYMLAKDPSLITMKNIFAALEGGLGFAEYIKNPAVCKRTTQCTTRIVWSHIENKMLELLNSIKLSDLINMHKTNKGVTTYNI